VAALREPMTDTAPIAATSARAAAAPAASSAIAPPAANQHRTPTQSSA